MIKHFSYFLCGGLSMKRLLVFAGPNGSGKSTIISRQQREDQEFPEIYICPDVTVKDYNHIHDEKKRYIEAMKACENLRYDCVKKGISFSFETVFSSENKLDFLIHAREHGYFVEVIFVTTKDSLINISRVKQRSNTGGHAVPQDKITSRYKKSMLMLPKIINICNAITVIDNSDITPVIVFAKSDNVLYLLNKEKRNNKWMDQYIIEPLKSSGCSYIDLTVSETIEFFKK